MILFAIIIGLLVYLVLRIQMLNAEVGWVRRYLLRTMTKRDPNRDNEGEVTFAEDVQRQTNALASEEARCGTEHQDGAMDAFGMEQSMGGLPDASFVPQQFQSTISETLVKAMLSAQRTQAAVSSAQVEEVGESDVELMDDNVETVSNADQSAEESCSEDGVPA